MRLTNEQKEAVRRLLALTETKQFALSSHSGLSPSVVSEMTNPGRDRDIQPETWRKFVGGLEKVMADFKGRNKDSSLLTEVERLYGDVTQEEVSAFLEEGDFLQDPGGWIVSNARNYVTRKIDGALDRYLDRTSGAMVTVQGAVQSGRSSAVRRLADQAQAKGFAADIVDFQDFIDLHRDGAQWTADKAVKWVLEEIGIEPPKSFNRADFGAEACQALLRGLEARTNRVRRAFLIFDSFDALTRSVEEATEEDLLARWLTSLRNTLPTQPPFDRMTLVVVANTPQWPMDGVMSSTLNQGRPLATGRFGDDEVRELFDAHDLHGDDFSMARGYALDTLGGHPYLCHLLAAELAFGESLNDVRRVVDQVEGAFDRHWRNVWSLVCRYYRDRNKPEEPAAHALQQAVRLAEKDGGEGITIAELRMLKSVGVLNGGDEPSMCGFYRNTIARKTKQFSSPGEA